MVVNVEFVTSWHSRARGSRIFLSLILISAPCGRDAGIHCQLVTAALSYYFPSAICDEESGEVFRMTILNINNSSSNQDGMTSVAINGRAGARRGFGPKVIP